MCHSFSFSPSNFSLFLISFTIYLFSVTPSIFVRNNQWIFQLTALHCRSHRHGGKYKGRGGNRQRGGETHIRSGDKREGWGLSWFEICFEEASYRSLLVPHSEQTALRSCIPLHAAVLPSVSLPLFPSRLNGLLRAPPPFLPSSPGSSLALQRKMRISHSDTMHHSPASKPGRPPRCIQLYVHVLCYRETGCSLK